jgi:hypothetical protein
MAQRIGPASTSGPTRLRRNSNSVAMPEVPTAAAHPPEEVGVLRLRRLHELAVRGHEIDAQKLVDRQPVLAIEPADPPTEREPGEAGVGDDPRRDGEPEGLRLAVELAEQNAGLGPGLARLRIDADALHLPQIDHHPRVADRQSGVAVAAASRRDRQSLLLREPNRGDHVGDPGAARDQRRAAVDRAVPDLALLVVGGIRGAGQPTAKGALELA